MSTILTTPFKKPECGDMHNLGGLSTITVLRDVLGGILNFIVVGTDSSKVGPINGATMASDYAPTLGTLNPDGSFFICIETDNATYVVELADGTQFTITAAQSHAHLGMWYPARLIKVIKAGTTGSFSVGY